MPFSQQNYYTFYYSSPAGTLHLTAIRENQGSWPAGAVTYVIACRDSTAGRRVGRRCTHSRVD